MTEFFVPITTAALALISGLAFVAYNHHRAYNRFADRIFWVFWVAFIAYAAFDTGYSIAVSKTLNLIASGASVENAKTSVTDWRVSVGFVGIVTVITVLRFIHRLRDD